MRNINFFQPCFRTILLCHSEKIIFRTVRDLGFIRLIVITSHSDQTVDIGVTDAILGWYWCYRCNPRLILVLPMQSSVDMGVTDAILGWYWCYWSILGKPLISFQSLSWRHRCCNIHYSISNSFTSQKYPSWSVLIKRCYENIQRIYSGTPMPNVISIHYSPVNLLHFFRNLFLRTPLEGCFWPLVDFCLIYLSILSNFLHLSIFQFIQVAFSTIFSKTFHRRCLIGSKICPGVLSFRT